MKTILKLLPGLILVSAISYAAVLIDISISKWIKLEAVTIAIILSISVNNIISIKELFYDGINFTGKRLLNAGIVLLGFKLNTGSLAGMGIKVFLIIIIYASISLFLAAVLGRIFRLNRKTALLIGAGSSICGASAVAALAPCLKADKRDSVIAITVVNLLGAAGVLIYSFLALNPSFFNDIQYGSWSGLTLHGVAHALAAAFAKGETAGEAGTIIKMARVLLIIPVSVLFSVISGGEKEVKTDFKKTVPSYVFLFISAAVINSVFTLPALFLKTASGLSSIFILAAMTGIGFSLKIKTAAGEGFKALISGGLLFAILSVTGYYAVRFFI